MQPNDSLVAGYRHSDSGVRRLATEVLGGLGPAAGGPHAAGVVGLLADSNPLVRRAAAEALGELGPEAAAASARVLPFLLHPPLPFAGVFNSDGEGMLVE